MTTISKTDEAHQLVSELISIQKVRRKIDVARGKLLWQLHANNLFKQAFGEGVDTWEEFVRSPEIGLTVSEANRAMQLYEYFVIKFMVSEKELEQVPVRALTHILPRLKAGDFDLAHVEELLSSAQSLTFFEFKERVRDMEFGPDRTYSYMVMRRCNETKNLSKVVEISNEDILLVWPQINE